MDGGKEAKKDSENTENNSKTLRKALFPQIGRCSRKRPRKPKPEIWRCGDFGGGGADTEAGGRARPGGRRKRYG